MYLSVKFQFMNKNPDIFQDLNHPPTLWFQVKKGSSGENRTSSKPLSGNGLKCLCSKHGYYVISRVPRAHNRVEQPLKSIRKFRRDFYIGFESPTSVFRFVGMAAFVWLFNVSYVIRLGIMLPARPCFLAVTGL